MERPHVLLIMVDDLTDRLGCYGDTLAATPNLDRLAAEGFLFRRSYCQQALCNPSRSSMLSGRRPSSLGLNALRGNIWVERPDLVSLPRLFREAGYHTVRAGKIFHMGVPDAVAVRSSGADDPRAWEEAYNCPGFELNSNGYFFNATPWETHRVGTGGAISWLRAEKADSLQHDHQVASRIIDAMRQAGDRPLFLAAGFIRPHVPMVAPKRFFEPFDSTPCKLEAFPDDRQDIPAPALDTWSSNFDLSPSRRCDAIRAYYACVRFVDAQVGRLLQALDTFGLAQNTVVVLVSDHGVQLGEHGLWFKNYLYRESVAAPLIIRDPAFSGGKQVESVVELIDLYPTLSERCRLDPPANLEGRSLLPLMQGKADGKNYALVETLRRGRLHFGLYTRQWSFMDWGEGEKELYDLEGDPRQLVNLADKPWARSTVDRLQARLDTLTE